MNKRIALIACVCIIVVAATVTAAFYLPDYFTPKVATPDAESIVWTTNITYSVGTQAYADGLVFYTDKDGESVYCYDPADGELLWTKNLERESYRPIIAFDGSVYVTCGGAVLQLNQSTGRIVCQYQISSADIRYQFNNAGIFSIDDQKLIVSYEKSGVVVYDLESGQPLWSNQPDLGFRVYNANVTASEISRLFFRYAPENLNGNNNAVINGSTYWNNITSSPRLGNESRIILFNYNPTHETDPNGYPKEYDIICIDRETGQKLWTFKPQYLTFNQEIYGDTLLFASYDGCFYAVNLNDGSVRRKTQVADLSLNSQNSTGRLLESCLTTPPFIDQKSNKLYWALTSYENSMSSEYKGAAIYSIDLLTGEPKFPPQLETSRSVSVIGGKANMVLLNNHFFANHNGNMICLDASGDVLWTRNSASTFVGPLLAGDKVIAVVGNQLVAYR